MAVSAPKGEV